MGACEFIASMMRLMITGRLGSGVSHRCRLSPRFMVSLFALGVGSNQPHPALGCPRRVVAAAMARLDGDVVRSVCESQIIASAPIGPSTRTYANAALIVETALMPLELLEYLKALEQEFGRRSRGQRWRARVLDLDILLWSGGYFQAPTLIIPHVEMGKRPFVLAPLSEIAGAWRDPVTGLSIRHLKARLDRKAPAA